jgi:ATP/maltotriose-dependent transcriptional regulator MalT/DNA-binding SARP family transcriptional activator
MHTEGSAKTMRPTASKVVRRKRLFRQLSGSRECPLIWVSGPPGCGKTTLVSSFVEYHDLEHLWYKFDSNDTDISSFFFNMTQACRHNGHKQKKLPVFTTEYRLGVPEFSHDFFSTLFSGFSDTSIIVLDNYQELPEDLIFHDLLIDALNLLPANLQVIIISRKEPSSKFSRLKANRQIRQISWQDLRFMIEEFFDVVSLWGFDDLPEKTRSQIYEKMDGWIAGLLFMLEGTKRYNTSLQHIGSGTFEEIFQYFAEETFDFQDNDIKQFLLIASQLPNITPRFIKVLTGDEQTSKTLSCLNRNNLFIEKLAEPEEETYQFHPLFQDYLQHKVSDHFTLDEAKETRRKAADLLLIDKQAEKAAELLLLAGDYTKFVEVVISQASILINQGRHKLLEDWLKKIPDTMVAENPCLSYWAGVCRQHTAPVAAKKSFKTSFETACDQKNFDCSFSSWAGLVDAIIHQWHDFTELDPLLVWLDEHYEKELVGLSEELKGRIAICMIQGLLIRDPGNDNLIKWIDFVTSEVTGLLNMELVMQAYLAVADYYLWTGNQSQSWLILSKIRNLAISPKISTLYVLKSKCLEATMYAWFMADARKCLETVESGLEISRSTGVHVMDHNLYVTGAFGALIGRRYNRMTEYLKQIEALLDKGRQHCFFCHHYLSTWFSLSRGHVLRGITHAEEALKTAEKSGHVFHKALGIFATAQALYEKGKFSCAEKKLKQFDTFVVRTNSQLLQYLFYLSKAQFSFDLGKEEVGAKYLKKALKIGRENKYQKIPSWWNPSVMTRLCIKALERKIEEGYVRELISSQCIVPGESPIEIETWPWPIKIYTLGRFEIVKDGKPIRSTGKAQQKPLAMLKAIIALGGRGVSEEYLADALWPDSDGDMQHQSLATTLHRLRKILGGKDMIDFQDGYLSINSKYIWVDVWAFERQLSQAETELNRNEEKSVFFASNYAEKAIKLYKGGFLAQNSADHWCIHLRERLKSRFLRGVKLLGRCYEKMDKLDKAEECYIHALEIDSMIEEFYQRLMICYHRMDRAADAVLVYKRCQENLMNLLQVAPSHQTNSIYKNLFVKS